MKTRLLVFCASTLLTVSNGLHAQGTAFTYQGRLNDGTSPANGAYDLTFALFSVDSGAGQLGNTVTNNATAVSNGLFIVTLDFGNQFLGANRWLEIGVRTNGAANFFSLTPRQSLTPAPYAITAGNVVSGGITAGTYGSAVTFNNANNNFSRTLSGTGASVTNVNAAKLGGLSVSNFWQTGGNSGTSSNNFLGTTDSESFEVRVGNMRVLRLENVRHFFDFAIDFGAPNVIAGSPLNFVAPGVYGATISGGGATNYAPYNSTNIVNGDFGTVGGGGNNTAGSESTVSGGFGNFTWDGGNAIGGGFNNYANGAGLAAIGGGEDNAAGINDVGDYMVIGGGIQNTNVANAGAIGGGYLNYASNHYSTVPGGFSNSASADFSFAAGNRASARHVGSFVWADSIDAPYVSTGTNQFLIRAGGGVGIGTTAPEAPLHVAEGSAGAVTANANSIAVFEKSGNAYVSLLAPATSETGILFGDPNSAQDGGIIFNSSSDRSGLEFRTGTNVPQMTILASGNVGIGTVSPSRELEVWNSGDTEIGIRSTDSGGHLWTLQSSGTNGSATLDASFQIIDRTLNASRFYIGTNGFVGIGTSSPTNKLHVNGGVSATVFVTTSDRNAKENFEPVSTSEVLDKVAALPITRWTFKEMPGQPHMGPMAQDFHAAFGLGAGETGIATVDEGGVALAAIQGLNQKVEEQRGQLEKKETEITELKQRREALEKIVQNQHSK